MALGNRGAGTNASGQSQAAATGQGAGVGRAVFQHLSPVEHSRISAVELLLGAPEGKGPAECAVPDTAQAHSRGNAGCREDAPGRQRTGAWHVVTNHNVISPDRQPCQLALPTGKTRRGSHLPTCTRPVLR